MWLAIARRKPRKDLCPWIQYSPPNFGLGNSTVLTVNPVIGCSRALAPRGRPLTVQISFYLVLSVLLRRVAGIQKHIGWHTFRHSFSTMLIANGENVKVVQELLRHSNCRCTLEIYSQARVEAKRDAQHRIIEMIVPVERENYRSKRILGSWQRPSRRNGTAMTFQNTDAHNISGSHWLLVAAARLSPTTPFQTNFRFWRPFVRDQTLASGTMRPGLPLVSVS